MGFLCQFPREHCYWRSGIDYPSLIQPLLRLRCEWSPEIVACCVGWHPGWGDSENPELAEVYRLNIPDAHESALGRAWFSRSRRLWPRQKRQAVITYRQQVHPCGLYLLHSRRLRPPRLAKYLGGCAITSRREPEST